MLDLKVTTINKAKNIISEEKKKSIIKRKKTPVILEYESYLTNLERGKAITITLKGSDKFQTIKYRLKNAAGNLGIKNIRIERAGNKVIVYREIKPRAPRNTKKVLESYRENSDTVVKISGEVQDEVELDSDSRFEQREQQDDEYQEELSFAGQDVQVSDEVPVYEDESLEMKPVAELELPERSDPAESYETGADDFAAAYEEMRDEFEQEPQSRFPEYDRDIDSYEAAAAPSVGEPGESANERESVTGELPLESDDTPETVEPETNRGELEMADTLDEVTDAQVNEEMLECFIFDEEWEEPMIYGRKTCETTDKKYFSNTFEAFGHQFMVTQVDQMTLGDIPEAWYKEHGLFTPREFRELWKQSHGGKFDPARKVWLHHFKRGFEPPPEPEIDLDTDLDKLDME